MLKNPKSIINDGDEIYQNYSKNSKHIYEEWLMKDIANNDYNIYTKDNDNVSVKSKSYLSDVYPVTKFDISNDYKKAHHIREKQKIIKKVRKYHLVNSFRGQFFSFYETIEFNNHIVYTKRIDDNRHCLESCERLQIIPKTFIEKDYMDNKNEDYLFKATKDI